MKSMNCIALVVALASLLGCTPVQLSAIQGEWKFDEARHFEAMRVKAKTADAFEKWKYMYEFSKKNGSPIMTDIRISGSRITTTGGLVRKQYDLSECRIDNGRIVAKALWHEDRNDPGDATTVDVSLQAEGSNLLFTVSDDGLQAIYEFVR